MFGQGDFLDGDPLLVQQDSVRLVLDVGSLGNSGIAIHGLSDTLGFHIRSGDVRVRGVGDLNGDGADDFAVGVNRGRPDGQTETVMAYVLLGQKVPEPAGVALAAGAALGTLTRRRRR